MTNSTVTQVPASSVRTVPRKKIPWGKIVGWIFLIAIVVVTLFPFWWILRTALSTNGALASNTSSLLPANFSWGGFERVLGLATTEEAQAAGGSGAEINLLSALFNSVFVSTFVAAVQVMIAALAAYAFSRLRWPGRDMVYGFFLAGLLIPSIFTTIPNFLTVRELGLYDTLLGIAIPTVFMTLPFAIFFLRQFFAGISFEIEEAALIDGAGRIRTFFKIILPIASPAVFTLAILQYIAAWNDYMWPLLVSQTDKSRTLNLALGVFRSQTPQGSPDWAGLMAATLIAALPTLILFFCFAKRIVNSIGFSGIK